MAGDGQLMAQRTVILSIGHLMVLPIVVRRCRAKAVGTDRAATSRRHVDMGLSDQIVPAERQERGDYDGSKAHIMFLSLCAYRHYQPLNPLARRHRVFRPPCRIAEMVCYNLSRIKPGSGGKAIRPSPPVKNITSRLPSYLPTGVARAPTGCMLKNVSVDTGDVAYCTNRIERSQALMLVIPPRANRKSPEHPDYRRYKGPNA